MASLLGQFFPLIKGSQEDIASKGVAYTLGISKNARESLNNFMFSKTNIKFDDIKYITQSIGEKLERPDCDKNKKKVVYTERTYNANTSANGL